MLTRRGSSALAVVLALLAVASLGASCSGNQGDGGTAGKAAAKPAASTGGQKVDSVPGVDVSALTDSERKSWLSLVNDMLAPCDLPVSVGRCVADQKTCGKCVPATKFLARLVAEGYERNDIEKLYTARYGKAGDIQIDLTGAPVKGAPMAPVTIVEFSDFQCPYCGRAMPIVEHIVQENPGKVRLVFLNYPLSGHEHSMPAARAAVAAGKQGKFWEMHDQLFTHQESLEDDQILGYAKAIGLDLAKFQADIASVEVQQRVDADREKGHKINVEGTPTIVINGRKYDGDLEAIPAYVREEVDAL